MKIDDKDTTKIFDLLRRISNADPEAGKEAESLTDQFYFWEQQGASSLLVFEHCEVDQVQKCFAGYPGGASSFYVPGSFKIKKVNLNKEIYSFFAQDGRFLSANLEELSTMWDLIPLGGERVNEAYVDWAFFNCIRKKNTTEYIHPGIGEFIFVGEYAFDDYQSEEHNFSIRVHVDDVDDLRACCFEIDELLDRIPELDRTSRKKLSDKLSMGAEELEMINLDCLDYYKKGEFDLTYYLPEDSAVQYVRVCYSNDGLPVETTFGNF